MQVHNLAQLTNGNPKLVRFDCTFDLEACDLLKNHLIKYKDKFPLLIMATQKSTHVWTGPLDANKILTEFILKDIYETYPVYGGNGI